MKKRFALMLIAAALGLSACQSERGAPAEMTVGQTMVIEAAQSGDRETKPESIAVPESFTGDWTGVDGCVVVRAEAQFELPDVSGMPVATVERKVFDQADADKLMEVFLKGSTLYQEQGVTKQAAQERLEYYQAVERGEIAYDGDGTIDRVPKLIEYYEQLVKTAPDENERIAASTSFQTDDTWNDESIKGRAEVDGKLVHISIYNDSHSRNQACFYVDGYGDVNFANFYGDGVDSKPDFEKEAAVEMGDELMRHLSIGSFACGQVREVAYYDDNGDVFDNGYEMEYVRTVNGCQVAYCPQYEITPAGDMWIIPAPTGTALPENASSADVWGYERVRVYVNKTGVVYFSWQNPYTEPEIQTVDSRLMDFSDIADIFAKMIMVKNSDQKVINEKNGFAVTKNIDVDKVSLSLMRIRDKDNLEQGIIVPVWDFWGTDSYEPENESYGDLVYNGKYYTVQLTVNAIDGTIIDRELGY